MISPEALKKIEEIATKIATDQGCRLYDISFGSGESGKALRIFIDKEAENGASLDDCAIISRAMNTYLDEGDLAPDEHYHLEVSTPGLERHLKRQWHFQSAVGKKIWVRLSHSLEKFGLSGKPLASKKQLSEILKSCTDAGIKFEIEKEVVEIPFSEIEKARVVFEFGAEKGKKIKLNKE